jgi:hypothetical protein
MVGRPEPLLLADLQAVIDGEPPAAPPPPIRERLTLPPPDWLPPGPVPDVPWVDLRAIDDVGGDPFPPISLAVRQLPAGGVLGIRHRWEPQPLYDVWGKMHLAWYARPVDGDEWQVFVHRPPGIPAYPIKPSIGVEVGAVPPAEVGPRVVALAEQLAPGQALQVTGASPEVVGRLRTYVATHLPRADLQSSTEPTAGVTVRLPDVGVQPSA